MICYFIEEETCRGQVFSSMQLLGRCHHGQCGKHIPTNPEPLQQATMKKRINSGTGICCVRRQDRYCQNAGSGSTVLLAAEYLD